MKYDVPVVHPHTEFPEIPVTAKLAIMIPTVRWDSMTQSVLGSMVGVANEEVVVLVADNSENTEKRLFLKKIREINPYVIAVSHKKDIGALGNFFYLYNWTENVPFIAQMADDDWMSPTYHADAYKALLGNPNAASAEAGTALVDISDGQLVNISQQSMCGNTPIERMVQWNCIPARVTMYNVSRRTAMEAAIEFFRTTPLNGITLVEDLYELNRLALGDFLHVTGHGCFVHYPAMASRSGDSTLRTYEILFKDSGLQYPFVFFGGLSTAVQCAIFLMGKLSPISDTEQRKACGQQVFGHIFTTSFFPKVAAKEGHEAAAILFTHYPKVMDGFLKYCNPPFSQQPVIDRALLDWFIELIKAFETKTPTNDRLLSERFMQFANTILDGHMW